MNDTTPRGYPLPHPNHLLSDDVLRLAQALTQIDVDVSAQQDWSAQAREQHERQLRRQQLRVLHQMNF
ncbi:MAG: hypothetical protein Q8L93_03220 [Rhodocyclaceae bacterium]|nr:hypothetical protein [Rhodocyclaceae bacterium]